MKKIFLLLILLVGTLASAQDFAVKVEVVKHIKISEATRDSYVVPATEIWHVELTDGTKWQNNGGAGWVEDTGVGGASQLSDLSDVNTSTPTNRNVLVADGVDFESRPLVEADISDLQSYVTTADVGGIVASGTVSLVTSTLVYTVAHGLGYTPDLTRIGTSFTGNNPLTGSRPTPVITSDATNIYFEFTSMNSVEAGEDMTWRVFGSDNATPMTGGEIVTSIDTQLGSTDWQSGGDLWSDPVDSDIVPDVNGTRDFGSSTNYFDLAYIDRLVSQPIAGDYWFTDIVTGDHYSWNYLSSPGGSGAELYRLNNTGTPSAATDLITKGYADANYAGGGSLPVDDTTALAKDPADNTKQVRFNVDGIAPSTTAVVDVTGDNQFQTSIKVEADGVSNNGSVTITKNDGTTVIGGMSGFGDTDTVEMVNTVSSESISIDGLGNYNLSAFTGGGNLALAVDNSGNIYTTTIGAGTIQSDTTGLGSAAYLPIANLIAWDYSVSTTPPTLALNEYGFQLNAPANIAVDETMDGSDHQQKLIYDDRTADVANITFSSLELGQEIIIYMNRTALPTFSGATMKVIVTGSETFQADTETVLYGFVNPDGEIDYTIKELTP